MGLPAADLSGSDQDLLHGGGEGHAASMQQQHSAVRFGIVRRHAVVIDLGPMKPSTAESGARDLEGKLRNAQEGSKLSGFLSIRNSGAH